MIQHDFNYLGMGYTVQIDRDTGHRFSFTQNGIKKEFRLKSFTPNFNSFTIQVEYSVTIYDQVGTVLTSEPKSYIVSDRAEYDAFYGASQLPIPSGDYYGKLCISGMFFREVGKEIFNKADGLFADPNII